MSILGGCENGRKSDAAQSVPSPLHTDVQEMISESFVCESPATDSKNTMFLRRSRRKSFATNKRNIVTY